MTIKQHTEAEKKAIIKGLPAFQGKGSGKLSPDHFAELVELAKAMTRTKTINRDVSTYSIKHAFERYFSYTRDEFRPVYVSEQEAVRVLLAAGFTLKESTGRLGALYNTNIKIRELNMLGNPQLFEQRAAH